VSFGILEDLVREIGARQIVMGTGSLGDLFLGPRRRLIGQARHVPVTWLNDRRQISSWCARRNDPGEALARCIAKSSRPAAVALAFPSRRPAPLTISSNAIVRSAKATGPFCVGARRNCSPYCRAIAAAGSIRMPLPLRSFDVGALGGDATDNILGGQWGCDFAATSTLCFRPCGRWC
jgi:hypothetical protein